MNKTATAVVPKLFDNTSIHVYYILKPKTTARPVKSGRYISWNWAREHYYSSGERGKIWMTPPKENPQKAC